MKIFDRYEAIIGNKKYTYFAILNKIKWRKKSKLRNQMMYSKFCDDNTLIKNDSRILVIAPHPDDESIACGGILAKYGEQIDCLCVNSSGIKYDWNEETASEIADKRISEFYQVNKIAHTKSSYCAKFFGIPPFFLDMKKHINEYLKRFNFAEYDIIFTPSQKDGHREHRFVSNFLLPKLLSKSKYKKNLLICLYDVWSAIEDVNYYEDISSVIDKKQELIDVYQSRINNQYFPCISGLNRYRGLIAKCEYAEAFKILPVKQFIKKANNKLWRQK